MERDDYARMRVSVLRKRAAAGDRDAARELGRRGLDASIVFDVRELAYGELRSLVLDWRKGQTPAERAESRAVAEAAQRELEARYRTDEKLWRHGDRAPMPPPMPPWEYPRPPRFVDWQRPTSSSCYPSDAERTASHIAALGRDVYRGRRAAQE